VPAVRGSGRGGCDDGRPLARRSRAASIGYASERGRREPRGGAAHPSSPRGARADPATTPRSPHSHPTFLDSLPFEENSPPVDSRVERVASRPLAPRFRGEHLSSRAERFDGDSLLASLQPRLAFAQSKSSIRNSKELTRNSTEPSIHRPLPSFLWLLAFGRALALSRRELLPKKARIARCARALLLARRELFRKKS